MPQQSVVSLDDTACCGSLYAGYNTDVMTYRVWGICTGGREESSRHLYETSPRTIVITTVKRLDGLSKTSAASHTYAANHNSNGVRIW